MMLDIRFSVVMLGLATGTYVAGLYGMNVPNGLEEAVSGFPLVTSGSIIGGIGLGLLGLWRVRKIKKLHRLFHSNGRSPGSK
jgi:magnesium transporter